MKTDGEENVEFFQALNAYMNSIKDSAQSHLTVHCMLEAWIRGYAAGRDAEKKKT